MMRAAVADATILSSCSSNSINGGLGGGCKGAVRQNVLHHATTIQTSKKRISPEWKRSRPNPKERVLLNNSH